MAPPADPSSAVGRIGFAGTPAFAATILAALIEAGRRPAVVYTQPDRPMGRGRKTRPSAVKLLAEQNALALQQPASLRSAEAAEVFADYRLDVFVVAAYGLILPPAILDVPRLGCLNVHASLLPRWRGAAPIERAIMAGDPETGVCIMRMERGLDTGPVYARERTAIEPTDDAASLEARLARLGSTLLLACLADLPTRSPTPQPESGVTYADKLTSADARIDWARPATDIERQVRALRDRLPATTAAGGTRVAVLDACAEPQPPGTTVPPGSILEAGRDGIRIACGRGVLAVLRLRLNVGKGKPLSPAEAINGYARLFRPNERLGDPAPADPGPAPR